MRRQHLHPGNNALYNVAIACLPTGVIGSVSAAMVATKMLSTFRSIRFGLLVGIGGGVPFQADIRLGDVVVTKPTKNHDGVVQSNYTKTIKECTLKQTCTLNKPPRVLLTALSKLQASHLVNGNQIARFLSEMASKYPLMTSILRPQNQDHLFRSEYHHIGRNHTCNACDATQLQTRVHRKDNTTPRIHYGLMESGNQVVNDGSIRDHLARQCNILCFEMEAAGLMDKFPCLIIRGISNYADSHKNYIWQGYAAATAATYAKELLSVIPTFQVEDTSAVAQVYAS